MPLQNRVTPTGDIIATDARGTLMGNRGIIHDSDRRTLLKRRWTHRAWVCCQLEFNDRQRTVMGPRAYTELFFLDEATALAAGHRPCGTCRHAAYVKFKAAWLKGNLSGHDGSVSIERIDRQMHRERVDRRRRQVHFRAPLETLCSGVMILADSQSHLVWDNRLLPWGEKGYATPLARRSGTVMVLTPRSTVAAIARLRQLTMCFGDFRR